MLTVCTVAVGDRYVRSATQLAARIPGLVVLTDRPDEVGGMPIARPSEWFFDEKSFNYSRSKRTVIQEAGSTRVLFLDADAVLTERFDLARIEWLAVQGAIQSPYVFSAYGFSVAKIRDSRVIYESLTPKLKQLTELGLLDSGDVERLRRFRMPFECVMLFDLPQMTDFLARWEALESLFGEKGPQTPNRWAAECNFIGLAAFECGIEVVGLQEKAGILHHDYLL